MLLAEDLLLLLLDDRHGITAPGVAVDQGLGAAILVELAILEKVRTTDRAPTDVRPRCP